MNIYSTISVNIWKTNLILFLFVLFAGTVAYIFAKTSGYDYSLGIVIFVIALIYSFISYFFSDKMVLATSGAKRIQKADNPELYRLVENLALGEGMPMPRLYTMHDESPNAFATGRDPKHAAVAVTTGIMQKLNRAELEGVLAHELSHIKNYDTRVLAITAVLVGFISLLADMFMRHLWWGGMRRNRNGNIFFLIIAVALAVIAPIVASLIQLAVSRKREFLADASGVLLTRYPEGLASALEKISSDPKPLQAATNATAHLFIVNPLKGKGFSGLLTNLFSTHPPIQERIKILRSM